MTGKDAPEMWARREGHGEWRDKELGGTVVARAGEGCTRRSECVRLSSRCSTACQPPVVANEIIRLIEREGDIKSEAERGIGREGKQRERRQEIEREGEAGDEIIYMRRCVAAIRLAPPCVCTERTSLGLLFVAVGCPRPIRWPVV